MQAIESDPAEHSSNPPVAGHNDLAYDASAHVVVGVGVEPAQRFVVASAVTVATATVLTAVAVVIEAIIQLQTDVSIVIDWNLVQDVTGETLTFDLGVGQIVHILQLMKVSISYGGRVDPVDWKMLAHLPDLGVYEEGSAGDGLLGRYPNLGVHHRCHGCALLSTALQYLSVIRLHLG